jgi:hypothetical protein
LRGERYEGFVKKREGGVEGNWKTSRTIHLENNQ